MSLNLETPRRKGATSARRERLDPINLVGKIMKKHPQAGVDEICRRVRTALAGPDAKYQVAFDNYCTRNHFNQLYKDEDRSKARQHLAKKTNGNGHSNGHSKSMTEAEAEAQREADAKAAKPVIDKLSRIVIGKIPTMLLDDAGKPRPLNDLNGPEGLKMGGLYTFLYADIGNKKLGEVKPEAQLQAEARQMLGSIING